MTKAQFKDLKVGQFVYLPGPNGSYDLREVTGIDRLYGKVQVIAARKPLSYRYPRFRLPEGKRLGCIMWLSHQIARI